MKSSGDHIRKEYAELSDELSRGFKSADFVKRERTKPCQEGKSCRRNRDGLSGPRRAGGANAPPIGDAEQRCLASRLSAADYTGFEFREDPELVEELRFEGEED